MHLGVEKGLFLVNILLKVGGGERGRKREREEEEEGEGGKEKHIEAKLGAL